MSIKGPTDHQLADRIIRQERENLKKALANARDLFENPPEGSPRAADVSWAAKIDSTTRPNGHDADAALAVGGAMAGHLVIAGAEHLDGLRIVLAADELVPHAALTLSRAFLEAAVNLCWLAAPGEPPVERMLRSVALFFESNEGQLSLLRLLPNQETDIERVTGAVGQYRELLARADITVATNKKGETTTVSYKDRTVSLRRSPDALATKYLPGSAHLYGLLSGGTHARIWLTQGLEGTRLDLMRMALVPVLEASDAVADAVLGHVGQDPDSHHRRTHQRRLALLPLDPDRDRADYATYAAARNSHGVK